MKGGPRKLEKSISYLIPIIYLYHQKVTLPNWKENTQSK